METTQTAPAQAPGSESNFGRINLDQLATDLNNNHQLADNDNQETEDTKAGQYFQENADFLGDENSPQMDKATQFDKKLEEERARFEQRREEARRKHEMRLEEEKIAQAKADEKPMDIDALVDQILKGNEKEEESEHFDLTPDKINELVEQKLQEKLKEREEATRSEETINNFKKQITDVVAENSDKYGLVSSMKNEDLVLDVIEADYNNNIDVYGEAWANENIMSIEDAAQKVQKHLESELNNVLQSDYVKNYILSHYGISASGQLNQKMQSTETLSRENVNITNGTPIDEQNLTDEERFRLALGKIS